MVKLGGVNPSLSNYPDAEIWTPISSSLLRFRCDCNSDTTHLLVTPPTALKKTISHKLYFSQIAYILWPNCDWSMWSESESEYKTVTLPKTNIAPTNGWLEYKPFLLGSRPIFRGENVSFREGKISSIWWSYNGHGIRSTLNLATYFYPSFQKGYSVAGAAVSPPMHAISHCLRRTRVTSLAHGSECWENMKNGWCRGDELSIVQTLFCSGFVCLPITYMKTLSWS